MDAGHDRQIRTSFTAQAETMEDPELNRAFRAGLDWVVELAGPRADDEVLDLAGGTGLVARALAPHVASVTVVDATLAMIDVGRAAADAEGLDVTYVDGDAADLAFADGSFSLVVMRYALHHMTAPERVLTEAVRVTRPGGRVVVLDLVAQQDPFLAARQNEIERQRDPSHVRLLAIGEVSAHLRALGCDVARTESRRMESPVDLWLRQADTDPDSADVVRARLRAELMGGEKTGTAPSRQDGRLMFVQTVEATTATRPN
jgi:SAM-dependent methyltransferase